MSAGPDLEDIARRLVDLAEAAGPWDDPLPEIRRRAAASTASAVDPAASAASAVDPTASAADADPVPTGSSVFRSPRPSRRSQRWFRSIDPVQVGAAAAVVALVAGLGWLIHSGGTTSSQKASSAGPVFASSAAGAAGSAQAPSGTLGQTRAGTANSAAGCVWPPTPAVTLRAPAHVRSGAVTSVSVRRSGTAAADVWSPLVVVVSNGRVVGRLVPKTVPPGPNLRPSSPPPQSTTVTGTLRRSTCAQALAAFQSRVPRVAGSVLPPGRYQLFAVATAAGARVAGAPVTVTVTR
jgi:hypothetical protein